MGIKIFFGQRLGLNKTILFSLLSTFVQLSGSFFTLLLIAFYFSKSEQGYYYTFLSLASIQIFFELGFTGVITQFVAHEFSNLRFTKNYFIRGNEIALSRLASLFKFSILWFVKFSGFLFIALLVVGSLFFNNNSNNDIGINWKTPWVILSIGTSINLMVSFLISFVLGLNEVKFISKIQLFANFIKTIIICLGIYFGIKLYVLGIASIVYAFIIVFLVFNRFKNVFSQFYKIRITKTISFWDEIFPYQWKIAISWISGFFIFQLFNPLAFMYGSPEIAGKLGMTLVLVNTISSISLIWTNTKVPYYAMQIANKKFEEINFLFHKTLRQSFFIALVFIISLLLFVFMSYSGYLPNFLNKIFSRLLDVSNILILCITALLNLFTTSWALYLRCFKREPFLLHAIITAILCIIFFFSFGSIFGIDGIIISYFLITLLVFPFSYLTYKKSYRNWQSQ